MTNRIKALLPCGTASSRQLLGRLSIFVVSFPLEIVEIDSVAILQPSVVKQLLFFVSQIFSLIIVKANLLLHIDNRQRLLCLLLKIYYGLEFWSHSCRWGWFTILGTADRVVGRALWKLRLKFKKILFQIPLCFKVFEQNLFYFQLFSKNFKLSNFDISCPQNSHQPSTFYKLESTRKNCLKNLDGMFAISFNEISRLFSSTIGDSYWTELNN